MLNDNVLFDELKSAVWLNGFSGGAMVKDAPANAGGVGDMSLIPGREDSWRRKVATHSQYSFLKNCVDGGAWWATVHGAMSWTQLTDRECTHILLKLISPCFNVPNETFLNYIYDSHYICFIHCYSQWINHDYMNFMLMDCILQHKIKNFRIRQTIIVWILNLLVIKSVDLHS